MKGFARPKLKENFAIWDKISIICYMDTIKTLFWLKTQTLWSQSPKWVRFWAANQKFNYFDEDNFRHPNSTEINKRKNGKTTNLVNQESTSPGRAPVTNGSHNWILPPAVFLRGETFDRSSLNLMSVLAPVRHHEHSQQQPCVAWQIQVGFQTFLTFFLFNVGGFFKEEGRHCADSFTRKLAICGTFELEQIFTHQSPPEQECAVSLTFNKNHPFANSKEVYLYYYCISIMKHKNYNSLFY